MGGKWYKKEIKGKDSGKPFLLWKLENVTLDFLDFSFQERNQSEIPLSLSYSSVTNNPVTIIIIHVLLVFFALER